MHYPPGGSFLGVDCPGGGNCPGGGGGGCPDTLFNHQSPLFKLFKKLDGLNSANLFHQSFLSLFLRRYCSLLKKE